MKVNDFHVVVYQILAYMYRCLKDGTEANNQSVEKFKEENDINERYWEYIWTHLYKSKLVEDCCITPLGINYLLENSSMRKAWRFIIENNLPQIA